MSNKIKLGVSLYSYQDEFFRRDMTLEDCIEAVADMGATGIEILPDEMIRDPFHMTDAFLDQWFGWMDKYGVEPVAMDSFSEENGLFRRQGRQPTLEEAVTIQKAYVDMAAKLGVKYTRCQIRNFDVLRQVVPYAEEKNVILGIEIHAPSNLSDEFYQRWVDEREHLHTKAMGLLPDFGIFETKPTPVIQRQNLRDGCREEFIKIAEEKRAAGWDRKQVSEYCLSQGATPADMNGVGRVFSNSYNNPEELRALIPYICGFHGKFWNMTEDLVEESINYEDPIRILCEEGFDGYINSEYEGGRHTQDIENVRGVEQVRRHHAMIRNYIEKYSK